MANGKDYYSILGVAQSASHDEIKKQYRRLAKQHHPDANPDKPQAADRFKEISEAYGVLGDVAKRKEYDEMRRLGAFGGFATRPGAGRPGGGFGARPGAGRPGAAGGGASSFEFDVGGLGGLGDLFSNMFGAGRRRGPEPGQTVERTIEVPFRTAATGGKVPVELEVTEECASCKGSGGAPGATLRTCGECTGRGTISFGQGSFSVNRPCPVCLGRGQVPSERCPVCSGAGEVRAKKKVLITVPAGAESGLKLRLRGQGGRGASGGPPGDLVVTFQVLADRFYKRDGNDLVATVPINIVQATLGSKVSVRTIAGQKITVRIPAGTASGKRLRVPGHGIAKDGRTGDLLIEVAITVPESLTPEQEAAMKQFAEAGGLSY